MEIVTLLLLLGMNGLIFTGIIRKSALMEYERKARREALQVVHSKNWRNRNKL